MRWIPVFFLWITYACNTGYAQQARIDSLLKILPQQEAGRQHVDMLNKLAFTYTQVSTVEAEQITKKSLHEAREYKYTAGIADAYKTLGIIYYVRGEYHLSAQYSFEALELYEELLDRPGQSKVLNNLCLVFQAEMEFDKVYEFTMKSLAIKRAEGDSAGVATSYLALAEYYLHNKAYDQAMVFCKKAEQQYKATGDLRLSYAFLQTGEIYHAQKNYPLALSYYHEATRLSLSSSDYIELITVYKKTGQLYLETNQLDSSYLLLQKAKNLSVEKSNRNNEMQLDELLSDYFQTTGRQDSALFYTKKAMNIEREIFNHQKSEQIALLQMMYNDEKKDQELVFQKKIVRRQYVAIIGVTLILILTIIFGFKFYHLNRNNLQAKEALLKLNEEVNKMNENLETMVHERTEKIKIQNQKLIEFTFFMAHEVRGPVARILGLIELIKLKEIGPEEKIQILKRLEETGLELDEVIRQINRRMEKGEQTIQ